MKIPKYVVEVLSKIKDSGFEAYPVGGCVRDLLMDKTPKDWDITTSAKPAELLAIFPEAKYENTFGTVLLAFKDEAGLVMAVTEVTTFRSEQGYSDRRHPDEVIFETDIEKDLERRDFTINALALKFDHLPISDDHDYLSQRELDPGTWQIIDLFGGQKDIGKRVIRAVGEPSDRFREDALRMMRAIRFSAQLGFAIEDKTLRAIAKLAHTVRFVANERIRDELIKIISSPRPAEGILMLHKANLLKYILPELELGVGLAQNKHHKHTVFQHNVRSLQFCPSHDWRVRLATLLHDVGKPKSRKLVNDEITFYNHEYFGAKITEKIVHRLKFSNDDAIKVIGLVKNHMFYYNVDEVTAAAVRRLIVKVGKDNLKDLIDLRIGDRLGSDVAKAKPYKLRHLEYMFDMVQNDPVSVKMLKINGDTLMSELNIEPGPTIGCILDILLSDVLDDPALNNNDWLIARSLELSHLNLAELRTKAKQQIEEKRTAEDQSIKKKHWVK